MQKFTMMLVMFPFLACATAKEAAKPEVQVVEKTVYVEVAPLKLKDCDALVQASEEAMQDAVRKVCEDANAAEQQRHELSLAKARIKDLEAKAAEKPKPRRRGGGNGNPVVAGLNQARPGGSVAAYEAARERLTIADPTRCPGPTTRGFWLGYLHEGDARANALILRKKGVYVTPKGCFGFPEGTVVADLDHDGRFDVQYGVADLGGEIFIPAKEGESVVAVFADCEEADPLSPFPQRRVCEPKTERRCQWGGGSNHLTARGCDATRTW